MKRFKIMIPAAGRSQRFVDAGYDTPKPDLLIEYGRVKHGTEKRQRKMLDWALDALPSTLIGPIVIGMRNGMTGPERPHVPVVMHHSRGQAHTLLYMINAVCQCDEPILVINSDVVFLQQDLIRTCEEVAHGADTGILVYRSDSEALSYVDRVPYATRFAEKRPISAFAMAGAWAFRSCYELEASLKTVCQNNGEPYLSQAMKRLRGVHACYQTEARNVLDWGTPEALAATGARIVT